MATALLLKRCGRTFAAAMSAVPHAAASSSSSSSSSSSAAAAAGGGGGGGGSEVADLYAMWAACPTAIDIAGDTVYLLPRSATSVTAAAAAAAAAAQAQASPEAVRALFERFVRGRTLLTLTATNPAGRELDAVENQVRNEEMRKRLAAWSTNRAAGTPAGVLRSFSWDARTGGWFEPGFAVEVDDADGRSELLRLGREFGQLAVYEYAYDTGHAGLLRTVVKCDAPDAPAEDPPALVGPVARPGERHPIYAFEDWYHLYHRASTVVAFFRRVRLLHAVGQPREGTRPTSHGRFDVASVPPPSGRCSEPVVRARQRLGRVRGGQGARAVPGPGVSLGLSDRTGCGRSAAGRRRRCAIQERDRSACPAPCC